MLRRLCAALGLAFDPAMLAWPAGPRASDGVWGAHWYGGGRALDGVRGAGAGAAAAVRDGQDVAEAGRADYERLRAYAL